MGTERQRVTGIIVQMSVLQQGVDVHGTCDAATCAQFTRLAIAGVRVACVEQQPQEALDTQWATLRAGSDQDDLVCVGLSDNPLFVWPKAAQLLRAAQLGAIDIFSSWVIADDVNAFRAAAQAGFLGGIYVGADAGMPADTCGLQVLNRADSFADAPRVMIPPQGGCWHDKK